MILIKEHMLEQPQIKQYEALLREAESEEFFYGIPLNHMTPRQVIIIDDQVVGCFEAGTLEYDDRRYHRTNRPYVLKAFRGKGIMQEALQFYYKDKRPAMCWIDDKNISSIRLFQNVGFSKSHPVFHKGTDGHIYFLTKDA